MTLTMCRSSVSYRSHRLAIEQSVRLSILSQVEDCSTALLEASWSISSSRLIILLCLAADASRGSGRQYVHDETMI